MSISWPLLKRQFFVLTMFVFYPEYRKTNFFSHNFCKKHPYEKVLFLDKIHGLTPLENVHFLALFKTLFFFSLTIILFFPQYQKRCFLIEFLWETPIRQTSIFAHNPWTNPFKKCPFFNSCENLNFLVLKWLFAI